MLIQGFQKQTLIDYPDKIASVIFTAGCNFRCRFCHNKDLVLKKLPEIKQEEIINYLKKNKKWIDAVVITGGEPTLHKDLKQLIQKIKSLGYFVKLDTNGSNPELLKQLLPELNYIAMDVKTSFKKYPEVCGYAEIENIKKSIELIKNSNINYEFRATIVEDIFNEEDAEQTAELLKETKLFILQKFQPKNTLDPTYLNKTPPSKKQMQELQKILSKTIKKVLIR